MLGARFKLLGLSYGLYNESAAPDGICIWLSEHYISSRSVLYAVLNIRIFHVMRISELNRIIYFNERLSRLINVECTH